MPLVCGTAVGYLEFGVFPQKSQVCCGFETGCLSWEGGSCIQGDAEGKSPFWEGASPVLGKVLSDIFAPQFNGAGTKTASSSPGSSGKHQGHRDTVPCPYASGFKLNPGFLGAPWVLLPYCYEFRLGGLWGIPPH